MKTAISTTATVMGLALAIAPLQAAADPVADFYANRTVTVAVGAGPAGGYAIYARLAIDHMARHMPGKPKFIFQSMPGGGGLKGGELELQGSAEGRHFPADDRPEYRSKPGNEGKGDPL